MSYASTILANNPTVYYRLGEASGTTAKDSSSNGYNGTISATGVTLGFPGALTHDPNTSMLFDGSAQGYIACPSGLDVSGQTLLSVECWIHTSSGFSGNSRFIANAHTDSDHNGFQLYWSGTGMRFEVGGSGVSANGESSTSIAVGVWYHIVGVYDGAHVLIYVNGVQGSTVNNATFSIASSSSSINIGRNPVYNGDYIAAAVDEAVIYKGIALSQSQIIAHYNARTAYPNTQTILGNHRAFGHVQ